MRTRGLPVRVRRYRSLLPLTILLVAVGAALGSKPLILAGVIPLVFVLQGTLGRAPRLEEQLHFRRDIDPKTPLPGQPFSVTLTVQNTGDTPVSDLRFIDGVPTELGVTDGSPRGVGSLRPGDTITTEYTLVANRGTYQFEEVRVRGRNLTGTRVVDATGDATGHKTVEALVTIEDVPIDETTTPYIGPLATNSGGPGIEFFSTREYRAGDPVNRINWNRYARTRDLTTIEYREQRAVHVTVVVDSRRSAHVAADSSRPTGATLAAYAASVAIGFLSETGHHLSIAGLGMADPFSRRPGGPAWASDREDTQFRARVAKICNRAATGDAERIATDPRTLAADGGYRETSRLLSYLPAESQVLVCTPAVDDNVFELVESIVADGHPTTVLSPDVSNDSIGGRVVGLERAARLHRLRLLGVPVIDWDQEEQLPLALGRSLGTEVR